ncbi:hypothetical protein FHS42_005875 [Streptomyces zagrosensis]|uniref:Uncharacterized protein n=1 Tax=Streptomyces zagrosensis TaxID=1042984 RepID=A0A7W9QEZ8_9ACTN|nr:hypothetical protein [Streptomyces zagrosensis]
MNRHQRPVRLPCIDAIPVIRTDFTDSAGWARLLQDL